MEKKGKKIRERVRKDIGRKEGKGDEERKRAEREERILGRAS